MIVFFALSICLLVSLVSFNQQDPSWNEVGNSDVALNRAGLLGAWFSSCLLSWFGYFAYLFPALLAYRGWLVFRDHIDTWNWPLAGLRFLGFVLMMLSATGLLYLHVAEGPGVLPAFVSEGRNPTGGVIGMEVGRLMVESLNGFGATLMLVALLLLGLTLFPGISWIKVMDRTGELTLKGGSHLGRIASDWKKRKGQQKQNRKVPIFKSGEPAAKWGIQLLNPLSALSTILKLLPKRFRLPVGKFPEPAPAAPAGNHPRPAGKRLRKAAATTEPVGATGASEPRQRNLFRGKAPGKASGDVPSIALLDSANRSGVQGYSEQMLEDMSRLLEVKLKDFAIQAQVEGVLPGPVVTRFEIQPAAGVKVSRITNLAKDLARSLAVVSVRVVEVIPGKTVVGIEIPNENREIIRLSEVLSSRAFENSLSPLTLVLGKGISGQPMTADLSKMPHLLVAGTTGSGKSVGLNAMLLSMLYKSTPAQLRLIMIDPKMLELSVYDGIPHLLTPVVTDMKEAANALRWCVAEMERRYRLMATMGVRNVAGYNRKIADGIEAGEPLLDPFFISAQPDEAAPELEELPLIVVVIDEFADMMMIVGKKVEELIARVAQKARAAGIHLILATQRPSVDVITGLIKANVPTRIAFRVSSKVDSRTILDQGGAEQLLGHGDMLYIPPGTALPLRVHGAFVDDNEVHRVCDDWRSRGEPDYLAEILEGTHESGPAGAENTEVDAEQDPLYDEAVQFVTEKRKASISSVQRKLKIGYNRAARMIETMEASGVVSPMQSNGSREVIAPPPR